MDATQLDAWIDRRGLKHKDAASLLGLTVDALRKRLYGVVPVDAQTARIAELLDERRDVK